MSVMPFCPAEVKAVSPTRAVLVVDDDPDDRRMCSVLLERRSGDDTGFDVVEAHDVDSAMEVLKRRTVEAVLMDYDLPDCCGVDAIGALRAAAGDRQLPVILIAGHGDETLAVAAIQAGASDYLAKRKLSTTTLLRSIRVAREKADLLRLIDFKRAKLTAQNEELAKKNREIREFYQTVSHELKTPLTAIREYNALMLEGLAGAVTDQQQELLQHSVDCCDRLTRLVNDLVDTARMELGKLKLEKTLVDVHELAQECYRLLLPTTEQSGMSFQLDVHGPLPCCYLDAGRIQQAVSNLVKNATQHTDVGGRVRFEVSYNKRSGWLEFVVEDNGCGICPKDQTAIFDRYYQSREHGVTFQHGMGIGLFLCAQIADLHDGTIELESELGRGSRFSLLLPVVEHDGARPDLPSVG